MMRSSVRATRARWAVAAATLALTAGCGGGLGWSPSRPTQSIDASGFDDKYTAVITSITSATSDAGFAWDSTPPTHGLIDKLGICSWQLLQSGTWAGDMGRLRDLRNIVNRALVRNGFHAAIWKKESSTPLLITQDSSRALLEVRLANPATIAIYSPAAASTCDS
ncbi:hypothetical protein [Nocardioides sp. Kera G14]|uniref:hypothetical protein n=1 Tax=Nocardioides sp. Kera G14 TaxID=2884264 RepID=UPI001D115487|nr:hypothetical protein [Nocardioides sp. Kera G14]UDY22357.1 hypothetical protein LH076_09715 [Nocardioides sp. Kera G14]